MITLSHHHTRRLSYALTTFHPSVSHHPSGDEALKVERLKSKMTTNLDMARERVTNLCMLMGKCGCGPPGAQNLQFLPLPLPASLLLPLLSLLSLPPLILLSTLQWVVVSCEVTWERKPPRHPSPPSHSGSSLSLPENHSNIRRYRSRNTSWCLRVRCSNLVKCIACKCTDIPLHSQLG